MTALFLFQSTPAYGGRLRHWDELAALLRVSIHARVRRATKSGFVSHVPI